MRLVSLGLATTICMTSTACYHWRGVISSTSDDRRASIGTTQRPVRTKQIEATLAFVDSSLRATVEQVAQCRTDSVEKFSVHRHITKDLPSGHWAMFGTAAVGILGGCGAAIYGNSVQSAGLAKPLGGPDQEKQTDTGGTLFNAGLIAAGVGLLAALPETVDLIAARNTVERLDDAEVVSEGPTAECERTPRGDTEVTLSLFGSAENPFRARTNGAGGAVFDAKELERIVRANWKEKGPKPSPELRVDGGRVAAAALEDKVVAWWSDEARVRAEAQKKREETERKVLLAELDREAATRTCTPEHAAVLQQRLAGMEGWLKTAEKLHPLTKVDARLIQIKAGDSYQSNLRVFFGGEYHFFAIGFVETEAAMSTTSMGQGAYRSPYEVVSGGGSSVVNQASAGDTVDVRVKGRGCTLVALFHKL